jgi:ribosomal protein L7/L12
MSEPPAAGPLEEIRRALAAQAKQLAIKRYSDATGAGPAEAAQAVDRIRAGRAPATAKRSALPPVSGEALAIGEALSAGKKIEAIRLYRKATGAGLKEAKDAIDAIVAEKRAGPPPRAAGAGIVQRRRLNPIVALLALAALFGTVCGLVVLIFARG